MRDTDTSAAPLAAGRGGVGSRCAVDDSDEGGNGLRDVFRFDGATAGAARVGGLDFSEGDTLRLTGFAPGTFAGVPGGNPLEVGADGGQVVIDSLTDLQELDYLSPNVRVRDLGDSGIKLIVTQDDGTRLAITLDHMAQDFNPYYDDLHF